MFTESRQRFSDVESQPFMMNRKFKVCFENKRVEQEFWRLLDHGCPLCEEDDLRTFKDLERHVMREHELFYCDLCVENLKVNVVSCNASRGLDVLDDDGLLLPPHPDL